MNFNQYRDKAYKNAVVHGWHEEEKSSRHCICLVVSELMEAVEADRKGMYAKRNTFEYYMNQRVRDAEEFMYAFKHDIKDSVEDELADACIRLFDFAGVHNIDLEDFDYENSDTDDYSEMTFTEAIYNITRISMSWDVPETINEIFAFCREMNIDIMWHIEQKMKYNELRPYKHGNKRY